MAWDTLSLLVLEWFLRQGQGYWGVGVVVVFVFSGHLDASGDEIFGVAGVLHVGEALPLSGLVVAAGVGVVNFVQGSCSGVV